MQKTNSRKAQVAIEYMLVLALGMFLLMGSLYVFFSYSASTNSKVAYAQIQSVGNSIILGSEEIAGLSSGSWTTVTTKIPENVYNITIHNSGDPTQIKELIFTTQTQTSDADVVMYTMLPIIGPYDLGDNMSTIQDPSKSFPGNSKLKITSYGSNITIERIS